MSKHYIVNCYTCQHNGQETCKGCRTLLVGDDEPYENWQLREDLETKDQKIADLEAKLAESEREIKVIDEDRQFKAEMWTMFADKCKDFKQELAEKTLTIEQINKAFMENRSLWKGKYEMANQDKISFALEQLEKVKEFVNDNDKIFTEYYGAIERNILLKFIDNQIKQLKEME